MPETTMVWNTIVYAGGLPSGVDGDSDKGERPRHWALGPGHTSVPDGIPGLDYTF